MSSCPLCPLEAEKPVKSKVSKVEKGQGKEKGDKGMNATQACIRAGYSPKTANEQGARLLANVSIQEA